MSSILCAPEDYIPIISARSALIVLKYQYIIFKIIDILIHMKTHLRAHAQIAVDIDAALKAKKMPIRACVDAYNQQYASEIEMNTKQFLNKDFVQRVRTGKCKIISRRVIDLCLFLQIDPYETSQPKITIPELQNIEDLIQQHPALAKSLINLLRDVRDLAGCGLNPNP